VSDAAEVRAAGFESLAKMLGPDAVDLLLFYMKRATSDEIQGFKNNLNTIVGPDQMSSLIDMYPEQNNEGKAALLELVSARQDQNFFELVKKETGNENTEIQKAAYAALQNVSGPEKVKPLLSMLYFEKNTGYVKDLQNALVEASLQNEGIEVQSKPILDAYSGATQNHERFINIMPEIGGENALKTVADAFNDGNAGVKKAAFDALTKWKDYSASTVLFDICSKGNPEYQEAAFSGYVRQIRSAPVAADQKLLLLKKVMPLAKTVDQKLQVIRALENNKTFLTVIYLADYMKDQALANQAGRAIAQIALPASGSMDGMYGVEIAKALRKAMEVISGEESDYIKANIKSWLEEMPKAEGFIPMFNGKDLTGWQGLVGNPISRAKMSAKELAKAQAEADAAVPDLWTVANGEIRFSASGYQNLCSIKEYGDFEMIVDWRITDKGDSGIYLRGTPQVQIWDISRVESGAQVGSGGLYNNQKNQSIPLKVADNPIDDWNTFYIKMVGENVTVYLNGELVVDNVILENYWDRSIPIFPKGPIELQAHGTNLAFRNVYVNEIKQGEYNLSVEEKATGFTSLFNGKSLDGWIGNKTDYLVEEGVIVVRPQGGGHGNLYTEQEYADFNFRFEFQLTPGANNGLGIRTPPEGDAAYVGMELQILDNTAAIYANLQPYQFHGSVYGVIPAKRGFLNPVGDWNSEEVIVQGTRIKIVLNGEVIVDGDIADARVNGTMDHNEHPGLKNEKGHIGFLGHGSELKFRNIRIKEL